MEGLTWIPYSTLIWIMADGYRAARPEFLYISEGAVSSGMARPENITLSRDKDRPCTMVCEPRTINGITTRCTVETVTLSDPEKAAATRRPDVIIICEPGLIDSLEDTMELLWGRVSERRGAIIAAGTSDEASEEWYNIWNYWMEDENPDLGESFSIPTWDNIYRYPGGKKDREFATYKEKYGEEALNSHYGGIPASPKGTVLKNYWYREYSVDQTLEWNPALPTEIAVDPNYSEGYYSVEVMQWDMATGKIFNVDEVSVQGCTHDEVIDMCKERPWWSSVIGGTLDPQAGDAHIYGGTPPLEYWDAVGINLRMEYKPAVATTVQALKQVMGKQPRMTVAATNERLLYEAPHWKNDRMGKPRKDLCDALKAIGYWLVQFFADQRRIDNEEDNIVTVVDWEFAGSSRQSTLLD